MPRWIRLDALGPFKIDPDAFPRDDQGNLKPLFICACGLSRTMPMCDGSHKACRAAENPDTVYTYDPVTRQIIDQRPA